jgi:2'-5' RNA ligase
MIKPVYHAACCIVLPIGSSTKTLTKNLSNTNNTNTINVNNNKNNFDDKENNNFYSCIQSIRKLNDKAYQRWMPHINLEFPFIDDVYFDEFHQILQEKLNEFPSFYLQFHNLNYFIHSKNCVVYLEPSNESKLKLKELQQFIHNELNNYCYSSFKNLNKSSTSNEQEDEKQQLLLSFQSKFKSFTPHLTLGQFNKNNIELKVKQLSNKIMNEMNNSNNNNNNEITTTTTTRSLHFYPSSLKNSSLLKGSLN